MKATSTVTTGGFSNVLQENSNTMKSIKAFEKAPISTKARNIVFAGSILGSLFLIGLFATTIIQGVGALIVTGMFIVGSFFILRFLKAMDPLVRQKTKNFAIEKMMKEAQEHASSQLDNQVIQNCERLGRARASRDKMGALVEKLKSNIKPENVGKPMHTKKTEMLERVKKSYDIVITNVETAAKANKLFEEKVRDYKDMESFASIMGQALSCVGDSSNKLDEMLSMAAFEQIDTDFSTALISIENSARDMQLDNES